MIKKTISHSSHLLQFSWISVQTVSPETVPGMLREILNCQWESIADYFSPAIPGPEGRRRRGGTKSFQTEWESWLTVLGEVPGPDADNVLLDTKSTELLTPKLHLENKVLRPLLNHQKEICLDNDVLSQEWLGPSLHYVLPGGGEGEDWLQRRYYYATEAREASQLLSRPAPSAHFLVGPHSTFMT